MKPSGQMPLEYVQVEEQKRLNVARELPQLSGIDAASQLN